MYMFHNPTDEKHRVEILLEAFFGEWLSAGVGGSREFLREYPAELLVMT